MDESVKSTFKFADEPVKGVRAVMSNQYQLMIRYVASSGANNGGDADFYLAELFGSCSSLRRSRRAWQKVLPVNEHGNGALRSTNFKLVPNSPNLDYLTSALSAVEFWGLWEAYQFAAVASLFGLEEYKTWQHVLS